MKVKVMIIPDYEGSIVSIHDKKGNLIDNSGWLRETEIIEWLRQKGLLEEFVRFMVEKILDNTWYKFVTRETKTVYEVEVEV